MDILTFSGVLLLAYLIGSIPVGLLLVKLKTGKDIREVQSGRTGGTNAMRAAGFFIGLSTALLDILKGASGVWLAHALLPSSIWLKVLAPIMVILGHNYSIFLIERNEAGKIRVRGGAGGAPCIGGSLGLWAPSILLLLPLGGLILYGIGYASIATISVALLSSVVFTVLALSKVTPWEFVIYGLIAELILLWSLRPNIKRLLKGEERLVGWRAKRANSVK